MLGCCHTQVQGALGANIANHYTKIAISKRRLPAEAKNLAG
jgi:tRNA-splicing ligase RtcB